MAAATRHAEAAINAEAGTPRPGSGKPGARDAKPSYRDAKPGKPRRDGKSYDAPRNRRQEEGDRTAAQKIYDGPPIPDDISAKDLDKHARQALQALPEKLADKVARHLVMAGLLMAEDPETAHKHALAARARATRTGLVREACGETAYAAGKWAEALSEFRAARRMSGNYLYAPMMADCERALKRPAKALEYDTPEIPFAPGRSRQHRADDRHRGCSTRSGSARRGASPARDRAPAHQGTCRLGGAAALRLRRHSAGSWAQGRGY
ncbi:hypothetical protein [Aeromicrobium sp. UC242_57]|uniref:hypothetical protein n=1 Tax=Aeromicrobium sp. UC242_57 TaxID=3374624 RepID=UPI0037C1092D